MTHDPRQGLGDEAALDALFAEARYDTPLPSADLLRRIEADAVRLQPAPAPQPVVTPSRPAAWLSRLFGRFALPSGLVAAGLTGIWLGLSLGGDPASTPYSFYDSDLGLRIVYEFPVLAGILPEG